MDNLREELYKLCTAYVTQRISAAELAIAGAREASNDDTKSSAGDKYETGREMAQQETNRNLAQLNEASKLRVALNHINIKTRPIAADTGSVVITDNGNFYIAISAGILSVGSNKYFAISPSSPIGLKLMGCKQGHNFELNGKNYLVRSII